MNPSNTAGAHLDAYLADGRDGNEPTDLDTGLGHTDPTPEFENDTYHYHVTSTANYISECLAGTN